MRETYDTTLIFWPATPLAANVAEQLRCIDVRFTNPLTPGSWVTPYRTEQGELLLEITGEHPHGLTDLEAVLATLRLADVSYVAWETKKEEIAGPARTYDPETRVESEFTVMADGEPVLTKSDLEECEGRYGTAECLLENLRKQLRLPVPENLTSLDAFTIDVAPQETDEAEPEEVEDVRERIAKALEDAEWPSIAADLRDGVDLDTVIRRINHAMEPEEASAPIAIIGSVLAGEDKGDR